MLNLVDNKILNSIMKNLLLLGLNFLLKFTLDPMIESFKLSDNYLKEILRSYFIAQRNTNNTVFINLLLFAANHNNKLYDLLFLVIIVNLKLALFSRFNSNFIFRKLAYFVYFKSKVNSQETLNKILGENNFNFMSTFEGFKVCFYLAIFVLIRSPTLGLIATVMLYLHLIAIRFSLNRSRITDSNSNYYGFYFSYTLQKEFLHTGNFIVAYLVACMIVDNDIYIICATAAINFTLDILQSKSFYTKFCVRRSYDEVTFTRKFEEEKFVSVDAYMKSSSFYNKTQLNSLRFKMDCECIIPYKNYFNHERSCLKNKERQIFCTDLKSSIQRWILAFQAQRGLLSKIECMLPIQIQMKLYSSIMINIYYFIYL